MERRRHRRAVWQQGRLSRLNAISSGILRNVTFGRAALAIVFLAVLFYVYSKTTRDVLIIDPFTVPKRFEEAGLTSEVIANRIGDRFREMEVATQTRLKKDNLIAVHDEGSVPDVEIPGTKLGLNTVVDIIRSAFKTYPKHISGDIVIPVDVAMNVDPPAVKRQATVTLYLTRGRDRSAPVSLAVSADDVETLVQRTAEALLEQVNPYVLAVYQVDHREYERAVELIQRMVRSPSGDLLQRRAAFNLWGDVLYDQKKYQEAIAKYRNAIELYPKYALAFCNWGNLLYDQKKYDEASAKFQKAIEVDPKSALGYTGWGNVLLAQGRYDEAIAKFQKSIELNPGFALPYTGWGNVLRAQGRYDEANEKFAEAKAREIKQ